MTRVEDRKSLSQFNNFHQTGVSWTDETVTFMENAPKEKCRTKRQLLPSSKNGLKPSKYELQRTRIPKVDRIFRQPLKITTIVQLQGSKIYPQMPNQRCEWHNTQWANGRHHWTMCRRAAHNELLPHGDQVDWTFTEQNRNHAAQNQTELIHSRGETQTNQKLSSKGIDAWRHNRATFRRTRRLPH